VQWGDSLHAAEAGAAGTPRAGFCWQRCCRQRDAWCGHGAGCAAPPRVVLPRDDSADGVYAQAGCRAADARARRRCCCPSARCSRTPTPTTRLCRRSPTCARLRLPAGCSERAAGGLWLRACLRLPAGCSERAAGGLWLRACLHAPSRQQALSSLDRKRRCSCVGLGVSGCSCVTQHLQAEADSAVAASVLDTHLCSQAASAR